MVYPFQVRKGSFHEITGTADLSMLNKMMENSGYAPIEATPGRAYADVLVENFEENTASVKQNPPRLGGYTELVIMFPAIKAGDAQPKNPFPPDNPAASIVANTLPGVSFYAYKLVLNTGNGPGKDDGTGKDYGRDIMHVDKEAGAISMSQKGSVQSIAVKDANGRGILQLSINEPPGPAPKPQDSVWNIVGRLPCDKSVNITHYYNRAAVSFKPISDKDSFKLTSTDDNNSALVQTMNKLSFVPQGTVWGTVIGSAEN